MARLAAVPEVGHEESLPHRAWHQVVHGEQLHSKEVDGLRVKFTSCLEVITRIDFDGDDLIISVLLPLWIHENKCMEISQMCDEMCCV